MRALSKLYITTLALIVGQAFQPDIQAKPESTVQQKWHASYTNDFSKYKVGEDDPEGLFILDGDFKVTETQGNKTLMLPGDPLDQFGFLFGPRIPADLAVQCRFLSEKQGRRMPTFSLAMGGVTGFRIKVNPAHRKLQLMKEDAIVADTPFRWVSGQWLTLRLQRQKIPHQDPGIQNPRWRIQAKAWQGRDEPEGWSIQHESDKKQTAGKCSAWGAPYSTHRIYFDELAVFSTLVYSNPRN